ncbi:hypothetical protein [Lutibacter sp.]|uniref:hypothetical protein n=1 Tax=Lutibacter sp. TaxID=1925666 RepID=UPI0027369FDB|nr:hypothetical protein [Lutibacter sp.]MDP3313864.1 hypothetical protein [Lutibacter sp.]
MNFRNVLFYAVFFLTIKFNGQEKIIIVKTDSISLFETYISLNSTENISPIIHNDGLIYASKNKSQYYRLYFSDLKTAPQLLKIRDKTKVGTTAIFDNEIYFSKNTKTISVDSTYNLAIYKGNIENLNVSKVELLPFCKKGFSYEYPTLSKDGKRMAIVTNENGVFHLVELTRNNENEWVRSGIIFITQPNFNIINPTFYNENTIYFSSNYFIGKIKGYKYSFVTGAMKIVKTYRENGVYNIYKIIRIDGKWQLPEKASFFNSDYDDLGVIFKTEKIGYINTYRYDNTNNIYFFELKQ